MSASERGCAQTMTRSSNKNPPAKKSTYEKQHMQILSCSDSAKSRQLALEVWSLSLRFIKHTKFAKSRTRKADNQGSMENNETKDLSSPNELKRPLEYASARQRLLNRLVDLTSFYALVFMVGMVASLVGSREFISNIENLNPLLDQLLSMLMYGMYVGVVEGIFRGKTLGKLITRTRAVTDAGDPISFTTGFLRGLSQAIPFEALSAFGAYPWHDRWTDTRVVTEASLVKE